MTPFASHVERVQSVWQQIAATERVNSLRVIEAFADSGLNQTDLAGSTGYGYGDRGRESLDRVFAAALNAEAALVRPQWASGTHVLTTTLKALLAPGDELWIADGRVYDTLHPLLGDTHPLSLGRRGVRVRQAWLSPSGIFMPVEKCDRRPQWVFIQRSRGYSPDLEWDRERIRQVIAAAHALGASVLVDNCYGEFTEAEEPTAWGADLIAGSLLKNPGGGIAPTGGYVAGKAELVRLVGDELIAPTLGSEVGPTGPYLRLFAQGLFLAPQLVGEALMGAAYFRSRWTEAGYEVRPEPSMPDLITAIRLQEPTRVKRFCRAIQQLGPIDAHVIPEPWEMPGYADPVIMAAGGMIAGASLELSCDAPMLPPYWVYVQGGLSRWHAVMACERSLLAAAPNTPAEAPQPGPK